MTHRDVLALMAKAPVPGKVKTRLAAIVGEEAAANLARAMLLDLVSEHQGRDYDLVVACNAEYYTQMQAVVSDIPVLAAEGSELRGQQSVLLYTFRELLARFERVIAVCADTPFVSCPMVKEAFTNLQDADLVLGPGVTGGYYLIGMRQVIDLFSDHRAGRYPYLGQTLSRAESLGVHYRLVSPKWDIDTVEDIQSAPWEESETALSNTVTALHRLGFHI